MQSDPRVHTYAELLVSWCLDVQPGWQVLVHGQPPAEPLLRELAGAIGRRDAFALERLHLDTSVFAGTDWMTAAPLERVAQAAPLVLHELLECDAILVVTAPDNTRDLGAVSSERLAAARLAYRPASDRIRSNAVRWVTCQYPTAALAQDAGLPTGVFSDLLFEAVLRDWRAEEERLRERAALFEDVREVRIVGDGTDLTLSIEGRPMKVDCGRSNMPGGEIFTSPVETSASGVISFSEFPAVYGGRECRDIRLRFEDGVVVDASAATEEAFLHETLDTDAGARRLGELGIGCNPGVTRYMRNILFDEKIDGTVHLALGFGMPELGGTNASRIHWDIVKDLRQNGRLEVDGAVVQADGSWVR